jgi:hypothetical protein
MIANCTFVVIPGGNAFRLPHISRIGGYITAAARYPMKWHSERSEESP